MPSNPKEYSSRDAASLERHVAKYPTSPLFARLASQHIAGNRPAQALKICLQGMRTYPDYPSGLLMIAKAQVMLRQYSDARETLHELLRILPGCAAGKQLLDRMMELELEYPPYTATGGSYVAEIGVQRNSDHKSEVQWSRQENILPSFEPPRHAADTEETLDAAQDAESVLPTPGMDLANLASRLETARIPALPDGDHAMEGAVDSDDMSPVEVDLGARPVTETLISIYVQQGKLREAIDAWHRLAERHPDRREEFERNIRELEGRLQDS